jgi:hypothetical protein
VLSAASRTADGADCVTAFALPEYRPAAEAITNVAAVPSRILRMLSSNSFSEQQGLHELFDFRSQENAKSSRVPALKLKLPESTVARIFISRSCAAIRGRQCA